MNVPLPKYRMLARFPGYRVGDDGSVWTCWSVGGRARTMTGVWRPKVASPTTKGHLRVQLYRPGRKGQKVMVHRLVLEAFVGPCPEGMEACHGDGNPANNAVSNLRWDTPEANWEDRKKHGRGGEGSKSSQAKLTDGAVVAIRRERRAGVKLRVLAGRYGVSMAKISQVALYKNWRHVNG